MIWIIEIIILSSVLFFLAIRYNLAKAEAIAKEKQLNINIDASLLKSLKLKSTIEDKTLSDYIISILEAHLLNKDDQKLSNIINTKFEEIEQRLKKIEQTIN